MSQWPNPDQRATQNRAIRKVNRAEIPTYLKDTFADIDHFERRLQFWEHKRDTTDPNASYYPTILKRITMVNEILSAFYQDARNLNRKLK